MKKDNPYEKLTSWEWALVALLLTPFVMEHHMGTYLQKSISRFNEKSTKLEKRYQKYRGDKTKKRGTRNK